MANESNGVQVLSERVHDPVFFDKLASDWNIQPRNAQEREQLLELAVMLRHSHDQELQKTASTGNDFLSGAIDCLKTAMNTHGIPMPATAETSTIDKVAAAAANDPELQKAALDYGNYMVAQLNAQ